MEISVYYTNKELKLGLLGNRSASDMIRSIQNHKHWIHKNPTIHYLWYLNLTRISWMYFSSKEKKKHRKYLLYGVYNL